MSPSENWRQPFANGTPRGRRRGAVLVVVLVCTLVALALVAASLRGTLSGRQQSKTALQQQQTAWLLQAGCQRAAQASADNHAYDGELWNVQVAFPQYDLAEVTIQKLASQTATAESRWLVTAHLGTVGLPQRTVQLSRTLTLTMTLDPINPD